jgi:hypothetical protein
MFMELRDHSGFKSSGGAKCLAMRAHCSSGAEELLRNLVYRHLAALRLGQIGNRILETGHKFVVTERQVEACRTLMSQVYC